MFFLTVVHAAKWANALDVVDAKGPVSVTVIRAIARKEEAFTVVCLILTIMTAFTAGLLGALAYIWKLRLARVSSEPLCGDCGGNMKPLLVGGWACSSCGGTSTPRD